MKDGVSTKPLQSLCDNFKQDIVDGPFGSELKRTDYIEEGVPVLKIQNVKPFAIKLKKMDYVSPAKFLELRRHSFRRGDIVMTKLGSPLGVSAIIEELDEGVIVADLVRIRAQRINTKYLCYHLNSQRTNDFINSMQKGTTRPRVTLSVVRELPIFVPSQEEQSRIVAILDEAFDGIATVKANAEKNLQNARALFESYLQSVFTDRDQGWVETTVGKVCKFIGGSQPPKSVFSKTKSADNIRLIQIRDYKSDKHIVYIPRAQAKRFCSADDVMIGRYGPPLFQILRGLEGAYNVALIKASPDESKLSRDFLFYFLKHSSILQYIIYHSERAAGQIGLTKETLEPYPIALPSLAGQKKAVATIMRLETETQRLESLYQRKLAALDALKKSLLNQAFSGKL